MSDTPYERYRCRLDTSAPTAYVGALMLFALIGAVTVAAGEQRIGTVLLIFAASAIVLVLLASFPVPAYYELADDGLFLRMRFAKVQIPFDEIRERRLVSPQEAASGLRILQDEFLTSERMGNREAWIVARRRLTDYTKFNTVPIIHGTSAAGRWIARFSRKGQADLTYLLIEDGSSYLLSPAEPDRLHAELARRTETP